MCSGITHLVHGTTIIHDSPNHGTPVTHCGVCTFRATVSEVEEKFYDAIKAEFGNQIRLHSKTPIPSVTF